MRLSTHTMQLAISNELEQTLELCFHINISTLLLPAREAKSPTMQLTPLGSHHHGNRVFCSKYWDSWKLGLGIHYTKDRDPMASKYARTFFLRTVWSREKYLTVLWALIIQLITSICHPVSCWPDCSGQQNTGGMVSFPDHWQLYRPFIQWSGNETAYLQTAYIKILQCYRRSKVKCVCTLTPIIGTSSVGHWRGSRREIHIRQIWRVG